MNVFDACRDIEQRSLKVLLPFIEQRAFNGQFVLVEKGPLAAELQRSAGDVLFNKGDGRTVYSAEIKAEECNKHGSLFLETWSNRGCFKPGWMVTLQSDLLCYHFLLEDELYVLDFQRLKRWAFHDGRIYRYPELCQRKREQRNDTWGRCVPIASLQRDMPVVVFRPLATLAREQVL